MGSCIDQVDGDSLEKTVVLSEFCVDTLIEMCIVNRIVRFRKNGFLLHIRSGKQI